MRNICNYFHAAVAEGEGGYRCLQGQRESHPVTGDLAPRLLINDLPGKAALNHGQGKQFPVDLRQF